MKKILAKQMISIKRNISLILLILVSIFIILTGVFASGMVMGIIFERTKPMMNIGTYISQTADDSEYMRGVIKSQRGKR